MIGKDELAEAARYADAQAEEMGLVDWCTQHGIDLEGMSHVAMQRALRAAYTLDGKDPRELPRSGLPFPVKLSSGAERLMPFLASVAMDNIAIGITAKENDIRAVAAELKRIADEMAEPDDGELHTLAARLAR